VLRYLPADAPVARSLKYTLPVCGSTTSSQVCSFRCSTSNLWRRSSIVASSAPLSFSSSICGYGWVSRRSHTPLALWPPLCGWLLAGLRVAHQCRGGLGFWDSDTRCLAVKGLLDGLGALDEVIL